MLNWMRRFYGRREKRLSEFAALTVSKFVVAYIFVLVLLLSAVSNRLGSI